MNFGTVSSSKEVYLKKVEDGHSATRTTALIRKSNIYASREVNVFNPET